MRIYLISQARETSLNKNPSRTSFCLFYLVFSAKLAIFKDKLVSQNANDQGRFVVVKTKLTTKGGGECEKRGDYIHVIRG
jgi:hypothetical protein